MNIAHRITKVLGSAACVLFVGGMLWSGLNGLPSLSPSPKAQDLAKTQGLFLSEGMHEPMPGMADDNDCVMCRSAPGPTPLSAAEKTKAVLPSSAWYAHWQRPVDGFVQPRVNFAHAITPMRIAFCRWLN